MGTKIKKPFMKLLSLILFFFSFLFSSCGLRAATSYPKRTVQPNPHILDKDFGICSYSDTEAHCEPFTNQEFLKKFECYTIDEVHQIMQYELELIRACKEWK